jgi:large conductance mechanosensitive channel
MLKKFLSEFREFAERGSAIDMAVGVIAGAAMSGVVNSLVKDVIMPPIGLMLGDMDMSAIAINLSGETKIGVGLFMNSIVGFILTMLAVFLFVRIVNKLRTAKAAATRDCPYCFTKISTKATKCPNCCSPVRPIKTAAPKNAGLEKLMDEINPVKNLKAIGSKVKEIVNSQ